MNRCHAGFFAALALLAMYMSTACGVAPQGENALAPQAQEDTTAPEKRGGAAESGQSVPEDLTDSTAEARADGDAPKPHETLPAPSEIQPVSDDTVSSEANPHSPSEDSPASPNAMTDVTIRAGADTFAAKFYDNEAAQAFLSMLPLAFDMGDLNRNEKMAYLQEGLPTNAAERPSTISAGEIKLYRDNCVVLFYDTFSNVYGGYTSLGYIEDVDGLASALGTGTVSVTFQLS